MPRFIKKDNIFIFWITIVLALSVFELPLRISGKYYTKLEKDCHLYISPYKNVPSNNGSNQYYYVLPANAHWKDSLAEFTMNITTNSLGFREREIFQKADANEFRVFCIGDSSVTGIGATSREEAWPYIVQEKLRMYYPNKNIQVYNCGIVGSDICAQFIILKDILVNYHPDLIVFSINESDIGEIILRGGLDRFNQKTHSVTYKKDSWWEPLYHYSHIVRFIVHARLGYHEWIYDVKESEMPNKSEAAIKIIQKTIIDIQLFLEKKDVASLFFLQPIKEEIIHGEYNSHLFGNLKTIHNVQCIDLLERYKKDKIFTPQNVSSFFWEINTHPNTKGYNIIGNIMSQEIIKSQAISIQR